MPTFQPLHAAGEWPTTGGSKINELQNMVRNFLMETTVAITFSGRSQFMSERISNEARQER
jgi:hypothetical protein